MITPEEYYAIVQADREVAADPKNLRCTCPHGLCEWHGRCRECVALHRYYGDHLPQCLQPMLKEHALALANMVERDTAPKPTVSREMRLYVRQRDQERAQEAEDAPTTP